MPLTLPLGHDWIARQMPHKGKMCLLDLVTAWDSENIVCSAHSHKDPNNPLQSHNQLGAACGIEYAAQAMALHGALLAPAASAPRAGYLARVRNVDARVTRLDDIEAPLTITAQRQAADSRIAIYFFSLHACSKLLLSGSASVIFDLKTL